MANKWKNTICRKWNGDDDYSWAIFNKGTGERMVAGLHKSEKNYWRQVMEDRIKSKDSFPTLVVERED